MPRFKLEGLEFEGDLGGGPSALLGGESKELVDRRRLCVPMHKLLI